jgi:hypothetical protein
LAFAAAHGFKYAGLENQQECRYGNVLTEPAAVPGSSSNCAQVCKGNALEYCGSVLQLVLYVSGTFVPPVVSVSTSVGTASTTSTSISINFATVTTLRNPQSVEPWTFQGCYTEATSMQALTLKSFYDYPAITIEECATKCSGYIYFGVEYGGKCKQTRLIRCSIFANDY